jgi:hypothetical protein
MTRATVISKPEMIVPDTLSSGFFITSLFFEQAFCSLFPQTGKMDSTSHEKQHGERQHCVGAGSQ